jgi:hypothetical protein
LANEYPETYFGFTGVPLMNDDQEDRLVRALERIARSLEAVEDTMLWLREEVEQQKEEE